MMRAGIGWILALFALVLAAMPYLGRIDPGFDAFSSFLPAALPLGLAAIAIVRRLSVTITGAAAITAAAWIIAPEYSRDIGIAPSNGTEQGSYKLTLVTHNISAANSDPAGTLQSLRHMGADIIVLQEVRGTIGARLSALYDLYPYHNQCPTGCDLAILSRLPIDPVHWKLRDGHMVEGRPRKVGPPLIWTRVHLPHGPTFTLATLHLPWPLPSSVQAERRISLLRYAEYLGAGNAILAGDFNLTPWSAGMSELDQGLMPMRRITAHRFSFPARYEGKSFPQPLLPIDHIFAGPAWSVVSVERLPRTGSDHYPLRAVLEIATRD